MKYIFIINGNAGSRKARARLITELNNFNEEFDYEIYETVAPKDATRFVKKYCKTFKDEVCFVACGGDGTINEVASGIVEEKNKYLAILAFGSGNDFVKYYKDYNFESVEKLVHGTNQKIDILKVNDNYSINVCNFGFDAAVCYYANIIKDKGGKNAYSKGIFKALFTSLKNKIEVIVDGEKISKDKMLLCTLANCRYVGGKYLCAPNAKNNDGIIDVCLFHCLNLFTFIKLIKFYEKGEHLNNPKFKGLFEYRKAKHIEVNSDTPTKMCLDGEIIFGTHFDIDILPNAINLILPKK